MHCVYCVLCTIFMVHEPAALQRITNSIFFFIQLNRFIQVLPDGKILDRQFFTSLSRLYLCRLRSVFPFYFRYQIPQSKFHCTSWCLITACKINIHLYFVESSVIFCAHASFWLKLGCVCVCVFHFTHSPNWLIQRIIYNMEQIVHFKCCWFWLRNQIKKNEKWPRSN